MIVHHALDEIFRSWSRVAVLRTLLDTSAGCTGNAVARNAGMHPRSALKALTSLEYLGIVRRQRGGRDHLFTLNRSHVFVRDALLQLYDVERRFPDTIMSTLSSLLRGKVISAVVFGSVARKQENPQSDLDLCCIVERSAQEKTVRDILQSNASALYRDFGVKIAPVILSLKEFRSKSKTPLVKDITSHGKVVTGKKPATLTHG